LKALTGLHLLHIRDGEVFSLRTDKALAASQIHPCNTTAASVAFELHCVCLFVQYDLFSRQAYIREFVLGQVKVTAKLAQAAMNHVIFKRKSLRQRAVLICKKENVLEVHWIRNKLCRVA
jgi:hypothetical protein